MEPHHSALGSVLEREEALPAAMACCRVSKGLEDWLEMASVNIRTVAQLMGHRTIQIMFGYAHPAPDHIQEACDKLAVPQAVAVTKLATGHSSWQRKVKNI